MFVTSEQCVLVCIRGEDEESCTLCVRHGWYTRESAQHDAGDRSAAPTRSGARLGNFGRCDFALALRLLRAKVIFGQALFQKLETFFRRIRNFE